MRSASIWNVERRKAHPSQVSEATNNTTQDASTTAASPSVQDIAREILKEAALSSVGMGATGEGWDIAAGALGLPNTKQIALGCVAVVLIGLGTWAMLSS